MRTTISVLALWFACGLIGELLLHNSPQLGGIVLGAVTLGEGISHFVDR